MMSINYVLEVFDFLLANLSSCHQAKNHQVHTERSLKLMIRAQAAAKERNLTSWIASSQVRVAETYLCDHGSSHQQAALDFFERLRKQPSGSSCCSSWAPFRRFFLERSILCGCTQLGLPPPAVCSSTRDAPTILDTESNPTDALRINLAKNAFEYLSLAYVPAWNDKRQGDELLKLVAKATLPLPAASIEIPLLQPGRLTSELLGFNLTFDTSGLAVPLELQGCILQEDGPKGHVETTMDSEVRNWEVPLATSRYKVVIFIFFHCQKCHSMIQDWSIKSKNDN